MGQYFIIYKTENILNGRFYVGKHATRKIDDSYLGSGKRLKAEIAKYGKHNFRRVILNILSSKKDMDDMERAIVTDDLLDNPLCLNLKRGGDGGWDFINSTKRNIRNDFVRDNSYRLKMSKSKIGTKLSDEHKKKLSKNNGMKRPEISDKISLSLQQKSKTEQHRLKISQSIKKWHENKNRVHGV